MKQYRIIKQGRFLESKEMTSIEGGESILCTDNNTYASCTDAFSYKICSPTPSLTGYVSDGRTELCTKGYVYNSSDFDKICGIHTSYSIRH